VDEQGNREDEVRCAASGKLVGCVEKEGGKVVRWCSVLAEVMLMRVGAM
jgi:hypothetical protein